MHASKQQLSLQQLLRQAMHLYCGCLLGLHVDVDGD
jgi:hypothetical protein